MWRWTVWLRRTYRETYRALGLMPWDLTQELESPPRQVSMLMCGSPQLNGCRAAVDRYTIHLYRSTIQSVSRERLGVTRSPLGQPGRYRRYLSFTSVQSYVDITRSPSGSRDSVVSCDSPHKCSFQGFRGPAQWRARRAAVADCRISALRIATTKAAERLQLFPHRNVLPL